MYELAEMIRWTDFWTERLHVGVNYKQSMCLKAIRISNVESDIQHKITGKKIKIEGDNRLEPRNYALIC